MTNMRRGLKKLLFNRSFRATLIYAKKYNKSKINEKEILFQAFDGSSITGNVYYILKEIYENKDYRQLKKYVVASPKNKSSIKKYLKIKRMTHNVQVVVIHSRKYCKLLSRAKYLVNNATFPSYYIKKEGQIYINTWHGTPLKAMGRKIKSAPNELGNTQRNFLMADYLIYQNEFMFDVFREDYMLNNFYKGEYLISGYPRNDIFYNNVSREKIRKELDVQDKKVFIYMPTWRGILINKGNLAQYHYLMYLLLQIDASLKEDMVLYVKLHNYADSQIDFEVFKHIKRFPKEYETYEFLNIADGLITDYSSVFFDYANTGKKIILFAYDKEQYLADRGMYINYDELPFSVALSVEDLIKEMEDTKDYEPYTNFQNQFCNYDHQASTKHICNYIFKGIKSDKIKIIPGSKYANNKENVLIFAGALLKNGITTALKGVFANIDLTKRNYILTFYKSKVERNKNTINFFQNTDYIPMQGIKVLTLWEKIVNRLYYKYNINTEYVKKTIDKIYKREMERLFPNLHFDYVIHFSGYEKDIMHLFKEMDAKKIIFTHSVLSKEEKTRSNFHRNSLIEAYKSFNKIVLVRENMEESIQDYLHNKDKHKLCLVHNLNDIEGIIANGNKTIEFDHDTYSNIELSQLKKILNDKTSHKFINIARFSPEKGLDRLIRAFDKFQAQNHNNYLIIIGGHGILFQETLDLVTKELKNDHIIVIRSLKNPCAILSKCDCFVLSSYYEGLPMTIMEALILDKKVISTDIEGPREFLSQGYGYLVENSETGLVEGFNDFKNGKLENLKKFDATEFNQKALAEFEEIFK